MLDARSITSRLNGRWYGDYGVAPCPICQPDGDREQTALTVRDGHIGLLAHCKKFDCDFVDIVRAVSCARWPTELAPSPAGGGSSDKRETRARQLWRNAVQIERTLAEAYLEHRGIWMPLPESLRFEPKCRHPSGSFHPAMIARVEGAAGFSIQRTFLGEDGEGKAEVDPARAMLGPVSGGAVRLGNGPGPLVVAEGIETALSYLQWSDIRDNSGFWNTPMQRYQRRFPGEPSLWAALSTSGMRAVTLPNVTGGLIIAADPDPEGIAAAHYLAEKADGLGWSVYIDVPERSDWNDQLNMLGDVA